MQNWFQLAVTYRDGDVVLKPNKYDRAEAERLAAELNAGGVNCSIVAARVVEMVAAWEGWKA